jgi:hypothetical protein
MDEATSTVDSRLAPGLSWSLAPGGSPHDRAIRPLIAGLDYGPCDVEFVFDPGCPFTWPSYANSGSAGGSSPQFRQLTQNGKFADEVVAAFTSAPRDSPCPCGSVDRSNNVTAGRQRADTDR